MLVALRKESVDRNSFGLSRADTLSNVALRKESVDRNRTPHHRNTRPIPVALRKESVDRNLASVAFLLLVAGSLSARRAWIEIYFMPKIGTLRSVALRKESVDRNASPVLNT